MHQGTSKVHVIVAPDYGERLADLPPGEAVWIADTPLNKPVIRRMREQNRPELTCFRVDTEATPGDWLLSILGEVELHHGEYSQSQPYSEICVVGTALSSEMLDQLQGHGFRNFEMTLDGFVANKEAA